MARPSHDACHPFLPTSDPPPAPPPTVQLLKPLQNMIAQADNAYNNIRRTLLKKASTSGRTHGGGGGGGPRAVTAT